MAKTYKRLTRREVLTIRRHFEAGETIIRLSEAYGRSRQTIADEVNYRRYKRVKPVEDLPPLPGESAKVTPRRKVRVSR